MKEIHDRQELATVWNQLTSVVEVGLSVPDCVLKQANWTTLFASYDLLFSPELIRSCSLLCKASGDTRFTFVTLEPDPTEYYHRHFRTFGAIVIENDDDADNVWLAFEKDPGNSLADALLYSVRRFTILPASVKWVVYGDRAAEVLVFSTSQPEIMGALPAGEGHPVDLETALETFLGYVSDNDFAARMRQNYANGK